MESSTTDTGPAVYRAIAAVMRDIGREGIDKTRKNQGQGFQFRGIDEIYEALNPIMVRHGLLMLPRHGVATRDQFVTGKGGTMFCTVMPSEFDLVSSEDGSRHTISTVGEAMDSGDKGANKAMSAALKYACIQAFMIPLKGNDDSDMHSPEPVVGRKSVQNSVWAINAKNSIESATSVRALTDFTESDAFRKGYQQLPEERQVRLDEFVSDRLHDLRSKES